jgi:exodeoxyribonuclease III
MCLLGTGTPGLDAGAALCFSGQPPPRSDPTVFAAKFLATKKPASTLKDAVKIATFNINNVNRRLPNLLAWLEATQPDVVCLQELKSTAANFPEGALRELGYEGVWQGQQTWNGVAILARNAKPILTRNSLPGDPEDKQSRYIEAAVNGVLIGCIYLPNGNPQPGPKFAYKLMWFDRLIAHAAELCATGLPVVLAGDYNVVPTDADIYASTSWVNDALLQPASRAAFRQLIDQGWIDAIRAHHPTGPVYTFWDYKRDRWARDAGLRLDHILLAPILAEQLADAGVDRDVRGEEGASDHAPAWARLDGSTFRKSRQARMPRRIADICR